jgi:hypothetical protein
VSGEQADPVRRTLHADIQGAVRTARLAADFDWTWAAEDLERFCTTAGWHTERFSDTAGEPGDCRPIAAQNLRYPWPITYKYSQPSLVWM